MSGQPGDIPKFVTDMIGPSAAEEERPVRPKSETAQPSGHTQISCDDRPKSDFPRASDATRLSHQARQKSDELGGKEPSKPENDGPSRCRELGTGPRLSETPRKSAEKPGTSSKDEKPAPVTINKETQRLVDELQRQYSLPVFINDGVRLLMDDVKETSALSTSSNGRQKQSEQCERICRISLWNYYTNNFYFYLPGQWFWSYSRLCRVSELLGIVGAGHFTG